LCPSAKDKGNKKEGEWREGGQARVQSLIKSARKRKKKEGFMAL
jgi:hypothetical protein